MHYVIKGLASFRGNGLNFFYRSAPWVIQFTNGDSGHMIGSFLMLGYRVVKPLVRKSAAKLISKSRVTISDLITPMTGDTAYESIKFKDLVITTKG